MQYGDKCFDVIETDAPASKFLTLETLSGGQARVLHVINLEAKSIFRLGRGNDADVRISDISVSRTHALLRANEQGECFLEDANSKFGTLLLLKAPLRLSSEPVSLQAGRTMLVLQVVRPWNLFSSCFSLKAKRELEGLVSVDGGRTHFPQEFLRPEEDEEAELDDEYRNTGGGIASERPILDIEGEEQGSAHAW